MSHTLIATDQDIICTRCDTRNSDDALYCVHCGASLHQAPTTQHTLRGARCPVCSNANPPSARFCVTCGSALAGSPAQGSATGYAGGSYVQHIYITAPPQELPIGIRALWFVFIGLWAGQLWLLLAWLLNLTLLGLPLGLWMLNRMPQVMTLRQERRAMGLPADRSSAPFAVRAVYFVLMGWWLSLLWMQLAWLASATIIGLPLGFLMFERVGAITTLADT